MTTGCTRTAIFATGFAALAAVEEGGRPLSSW
jgi:hypothetical protein